MLWFIHRTYQADRYDTVRVRRGSAGSSAQEPDLSFIGHLLTSQKFWNMQAVVTYAERLLGQNNLPDTVRVRLKAFVDRYYNRVSFVLDALDNKYDPKAKKKRSVRLIAKVGVIGRKVRTNPQRRVRK